MDGTSTSNRILSEELLLNERPWDGGSFGLEGCSPMESRLVVPRAARGAEACRTLPYVGSTQFAQSLAILSMVARLELLGESFGHRTINRRLIPLAYACSAGEASMLPAAIGAFRRASMPADWCVRHRACVHPVAMPAVLAATQTRRHPASRARIAVACGLLPHAAARKPGDAVGAVRGRCP